MAAPIPWCHYCSSIQLSSVGESNFDCEYAKMRLAHGWIRHPDRRPSLVLQCRICRERHQAYIDVGLL